FLLGLSLAAAVLLRGDLWDAVAGAGLAAISVAAAWLSAAVRRRGPAWLRALRTGRRRWTARGWTQRAPGPRRRRATSAAPRGRPGAGGRRGGRATSRAEWASTGRARARRIEVSVSVITRSRSIQPLAAAASTIAYSPDTWYAATGTGTASATWRTTSR